MVLLALGWLAALTAWAAGTWGLFGAARDPLAGVFLLPLGWPWNTQADRLPEAARFWFLPLAPVLNLIVLGLLCRLVRR
jgi:hypothetical protein